MSRPAGGRIAASGTVHWIGTGLSTGGGLGALCDRASEVVLWARSEEKASRCLDRLGLTGRAQTRALDRTLLHDQIKPGDVLVSMLPATEHADLLRLCVQRDAHFACSSYTSDDVTAHVPAAEQAGLAVLTEAGLDPGLDHALAHVLVAQARAAVGDGPATAWFTSYCGGLPAVPNEFRYRFSWAPRGVLSALCSPARYIEAGQPIEVERPWEATRRHTLGGEDFDAYPNRDSVVFLAQYGFPTAWRAEAFVRGTLRLSGWREAWAPVFDVLRSGDGQRIDELAVDLAHRYPTTDADPDRVVLAVALTVHSDRGPQWSAEYRLDLLGDESENAMSRCVSFPLAFGVLGILDGTTPAGLCRAVRDADEAQRLISHLRSYGIDCRPTT